MKKTFKSLWHIFLLVYYKLAFYTGGVIDDEYYSNMAIQWMELDQYKKALYNLEKAIKTYDVSSMRYYMGWCYQNLNEHEKAIFNYDKAYEKNKQDIYIIYNAYCKYRLGNKNDSIGIINSIKTIGMEDILLKEFNRVKDIITNNK